MALFNETLAGRWNEIIRRIHSVKQVPAPQISPEIVHDITLESDRPEWLVLHGGFPWSVRTSSGPAATKVSVAGVRNPTGSGMLIVVTGIREVQQVVGTPAASQVLLVVRPQAAMANSGATEFTDTRRGESTGNNGSPITVTDNTSFANFGAVGGRQLEGVILLVATPFADLMTPPIVLSPGFDLLLVGVALNLGVEGTFKGYARAITPEELNIL